MPEHAPALGQPPGHGDQDTRGPHLVHPVHGPALEQFHHVHTGREDIMFPGHYPTLCLLGSIDMTECLAQEEYRDLYPEGESGSPYVFIFSNPQELMIKFPMSGKHKLIFVS